MTRLLPLGLALLLAACGSNRVYNSDYSTAYSITELSSAAARGPVPVVVSGNPFNLPPERVNTAIAVSMPTYFAGNLSFAPAPPADPKALNRVVYAFGKSGGRRDEICGLLPSTAQVPMPDGLEVTAAFCRGPTALSSAVGTVPMPLTPEDPAFRELISNLTLTLFPTRNPQTDTDRRFPLFLGLGGGFGSGGSFISSGVGFGF
jgi:hypothetical protein